MAPAVHPIALDQGWLTAANNYGRLIVSTSVELVQSGSMRVIWERGTGMSDLPHRGETSAADETAVRSLIEIITDEAKVREIEPMVHVRTGLTGGKTFVIKINQPEGRARLIAFHL
jgi:hypothetical protein